MILQELKGLRCPKCKNKLDACTAADGVSKPKDGDYSVCVYCGSVVRFRVVNGNYSYEIITSEGLLELLKQDYLLWKTLQGAIGAVQMMILEKQSKLN